MKLAVRIDVTAAIKAGKKDAGTQVIDLDPADLTQPERELLAAKITTSQPVSSDFRSTAADAYLCYAPGGCSLVEPTVADLRRLLGEIITTEAEVAAKRAETVAAEEVERAKKDTALAAGPLADLIRSDYGMWQPILQVLHPRSYPLTAARLAEVQAECDRRNAERAAAAKAEEDAKVAAKAEGERLLREWAAASGSELLRSRLAGGFAWVGLAREEFAAAAVAAVGLPAADTPDGYQFSQTEDRRSPTLAEIRCLESVRSQVPPFTAASLVWAKYVPEAEADEDADPVARCEVRVRVQTPDGGEEIYDFLPQ